MVYLPLCLVIEIDIPLDIQKKPPVKRWKTYIKVTTFYTPSFEPKEVNHVSLPTQACRRSLKVFTVNPHHGDFHYGWENTHFIVFKG
jgi:hypothetical protein